MGSAHSCHSAPSNDSTTDAAQVKGVNLKYGGFRNDGGGAEGSEWEGPTRVTTCIRQDVRSKAPYVLLMSQKSH